MNSLYAKRRLTRGPLPPPLSQAILALCLLGAASAAVVPLTYTAGTYPFAGGFVPYNAGVFPFSAGVLPYSYGVQPITYVAKPVTTHVVQPGYVAQTKGSTHIAPLPSGLGYASHHINVADAPGTQ